MAKSYMTSDDLIASVKRRAAIPINQNTFTDDDILAMANEEMMIGLVPSILQLHEEYFVVTETFDIVAEQAEYDIPYRAIGNKLRQLSFRDDNNNLFEMTRIQPEIQYENQRATGVNAIYKFKVKNNQVVLIPTPSPMPTGRLDMDFFLRPNAMVRGNRAGIITAIDTVLGTVTVSSLPSVFVTSALYDFIRVDSPHKILSYDIAPVSIDSVTKTLTFAPADVPSGLVVGDSIMLAGETYVPNIPTDLHVMLAHRVAARCLEAQGDTQGLQNANAKLQEMEYKTGSIIDNRVDGSPQKIVNRHNIMRMGKIGRKRNFL